VAIAVPNRSRSYFENPVIDGDAATRCWDGIMAVMAPVYSAGMLGCSGLPVLIGTCLLMSFVSLVRWLLFMVALCNRADHIYFHPVSFSLLFYFLT